MGFSSGISRVIIPMISNLEVVFCGHWVRESNLGGLDERRALSPLHPPMLPYLPYIFQHDEAGFYVLLSW